MTIDAQAFQAFLYAHIPLVKAMQMQLHKVSDHKLSASAPTEPNINDKLTVFGGSSSALMTICGWALIKTNLETRGIHNDVVIHKANNQWIKAQTDDLIINARMDSSINWDELCKTINEKNRSKKIQIHCQVLNQANEICSEMSGQYVILKK